MHGAKQKLMALGIEAGFSSAMQIAKHCGYTPKWFYEALNGKRTPTRASIERVAEAVKASPEVVEMIFAIARSEARP